jgi:hypothetical protein
MVTYFTLMTPGAGQEASGFREWFLREHAPMVLKHCPLLRGYAVNLRERAPACDNMPQLEEAPGPRRRYQVITQMWFDAAGDFTDPARLYDSADARREIEDALRARAGEVFTYRVTQNIEKNEHPRVLGERSPGVKMITIAGWKPGLSEREGRLGWEVHAPLALRTHTGFSRYVRNVVEESLTPGAPDYKGMAELVFLTLEDAVHRFFPTPAAAEIIRFDTSRWMLAYEGAFVGEYVLK